MPLDIPPLRVVVAEHGGLVVVLSDGRTAMARLAVPDEPEAVAGWRSHFATCPKASTFRKAKGA